jgi:LysM repeat protein
MNMPGRKFQAGTQSYRYSINGQEKDKELNENITTAQFWEYDSRIGRRWNIDPVSKIWESGYATFSNNPINRADPFGDTDGDPKYQKTKQGDTYSKIAKKTGASVEDLRKWNGYKDDDIPIGVPLIVGWTNTTSSSKSAGGNGYQKDESGTVKKVTDYAEKAYNVYETVAKVVNNTPGGTTAVNILVVAPAATAASIATTSNTDKQTWGDLFNIWFYELNKGVINNSISYGANANTTQSLKNQEGINQARQLAEARARVGNTNPVSWTWTFGVNAAKDAVKTNNIVTAFLGSYTISVTTNINSQTKAITLTYTVMNTSGWASATRFRKDNDGDGAHDGIIQDKARGAGIKLGGNLRETWGWTENIK